MAKVTRKKSSLVGLKELRENMEKYITATEKGRSFTVLRRSKPIFKIMPVDEWGDEGAWETVIDFTKIHPKGVPSDVVLRALKEIRKEGAHKHHG
jgi:prevent-host-death family protein